MTTKEAAFKSIAKIKLILDSQNLSSSAITEKEYDYEMTVKLNSANIKILVYFGKKGLRTVLQGDSNSSEYRIIQDLVMDQSSLHFTRAAITEPNAYIGSDECGKGDFFGPLVVGAVYVEKESVAKLAKMGVRDSKDLNENQIHHLAHEIKMTVGKQFEVIRITPEKYNGLYSRFANLNKLLNWAHSKSIEKLLDNTGCKFVITDKFSKEDLKVVSSAKYSDVEFVQIEKAEKYIGVAAASILARDNFNSWFLEQTKKGITLPKGASNNIELTASKLLAEYGEEKLGELAKLHFKTYKKIKEN